MDIGEAISTILFHLLTMSREPAKAQMQIQHTGPKRGMQSFGLLVSGSQAYMGFNFFFFVCYSMQGSRVKPPHDDLF